MYSTYPGIHTALKIPLIQKDCSLNILYKLLQLFLIILCLITVTVCEGNFTF